MSCITYYNPNKYHLNTEGELLIKLLLNIYALAGSAWEIQ